jgi:hypothetical protein
MVLSCFCKLIFISVTTAVLGGCVIARNIVVGISRDVENYYGIYASVEFDTAAVTNDEADQIKRAGVDGYFAPGNALRRSLEPFTVYFSEEETAPKRLRAESDYWRRWENKKPEKLLFIADLPYSPDSPQDDQRLIFIDIKRQFFEPRSIYIEVYPEKIVRVYKKLRNPRRVYEQPKATVKSI